MLRSIQILLFTLVLVQVLLAAPVDPKKEEKSKDKKKETESEELDDFGLEYGRYLQQVVQALEEDKEFAKKLENISSEQIRTGQIAEELEFVKHNVRTKLDELKRIEVDRLRKLVQEQMERTELGLYRDEDGRLLPSPDGRRWRTVAGRPGASESGGGDFWLALDRKGVKIPQHLDVENPHSFEISDLKKLIHTATKDLEALDKQRREEFKKYELEKEAKYRESLKNMTEEQKKETEKHHEEMLQKHKEHPKIHHPGSKPQLEQVWEEEDHMPKEDFNPRTFFAMHDINSDGHLDENEVEAVLRPEVKKMYNPENEEDDPAEMEEEYHRMREHVFNETDKNKDGLISLEEFLKMTEQQEFQQDDGWKGLDEQSVYSEAELEEYMRQRQMALNQQYYGDPRAYYDVPHAQNQGMPPHINYQGNHPGMPPQQPQYHQPAYPQQGHQQQPQFREMPQQQHYQGVPPQQQQYQGVPPHQQQYQHQGVPPQQYQAMPPQQHQGMPQQHQGMQQMPPQQGVPPQHQGMQQMPPQPHQGVPPQQHQGAPPQQNRGVPQQQHQAQPGPSENAIPHQPSLPSQNLNQAPGGKPQVDAPSPNAIPQQQQKN